MSEIGKLTLEEMAKYHNECPSCKTCPYKDDYRICNISVIASKLDLTREVIKKEDED